MTQRAERPLVARPELASSLRAAYDASADGPRSVLLSGESGSGRRTALDAFLRKLGEDGESPGVLRVRAQPGDDGVRSLLRVYGSFITALTRKGLLGDDDPSDVLESTAEASSDEQVSTWLRSVAESVRALRGHSGPGQYQIQLPQQNPYLALLYTLDVLGPKARWVVDLQEAGGVISPTFWTFLAALVGRARARNWKVLFVVTPGRNRYAEKPADKKPGPLSFVQQLFGEGEVLTVPPMSVEQVAELLEDTYRPNKFPEGTAAAVHAACGGLPDLLHEVLDVLEEDETITWDDKGYELSDLEDVDIDVLVPVVREDDEEVDEDTVPEDVLDQVLHVAAHAGRTFPGALLRAFLDLDDDTVDDSLDAMPHIIEEVRYDEGLGSWLYRFRFEFQRRWFQAHPPEGFKTPAKEIARALGTVVMQSYAPANFDYVPRAAELYDAAGEGQGARALLAMAMGSDRGELHRFALEIGERFEDSPFPAQLMRFLHTSHADRAVNGAPVDAAEAAVAAMGAWAEQAGDTDTAAFSTLLSCRIAVRKGELDGARALGEQALEAYRKADDATRVAEVLNQLAMVALNQGDGSSAQRFVLEAGKSSTIPPVRAHSSYIEGLLHKAQRQLPQALDAFTRATELSTKTGNLALTLESMLNEGETALMVGRLAEKAPMLERAMEMSRALRSANRERVAARLLCQAEAARGNHEMAYEVAKHALQMTRDLKLDDQVDVDLYHAGLFAVLAGKKDEGMDFLGDARKAAEAAGHQGLLPEILFNLAQIKLSEGDAAAARSMMEQALAKSREGNNTAREVQILRHLAIATGATGDLPGAVARIKEALDKVPGGSEWKQLRTELRNDLSQAQSAAAQADKE